MDGKLGKYWLPKRSAKLRVEFRRLCHVASDERTAVLIGQRKRPECLGTRLYIWAI
jgi:hypothetical protein